MIHKIIQFFKLSSGQMATSLYLTKAPITGVVKPIKMKMDNEKNKQNKLIAAELLLHLKPIVKTIITKSMIIFSTAAMPHSNELASHK